MTAAVVLLSIALAGAVGGLITLAVKALGAERRCGDSRAHETDVQARLEMAIATIHTESLRADKEKERGDALDAAIAKFAVDAVGSVDGSAARLLQAVNAIRAGASGHAGADVVRDEGAAGETPGTIDPASDSDLLRPGEEL